MTEPVPSRFVLLSICLAALALCPPATAARPLLTGFLDPDASATQRADLMLTADDAAAWSRDAGASIDRLYLYWNRVATAEPVDPDDPNDPAYDWSVVDGQVDAAITHGLEPMLDFRSAPLWAQGPGGNASGTVSPDAGALASFARAAAARYAGRVRYWEIWNEPNSRGFLRPQRDAEGRSIAPKLYRGLVNAAAAALHEADPDNVVVVGGTAPRASADGHSPLDFLRKLFAAPVEADVFSHHPYTLGSPERHAARPDDVYLADLTEWARLVRAAVRAGRVLSHGGTPKTRVPLWVSELSWDSRPPDPTGVPARLHARWTAEALYRSWRAGASVLIWGQLRDYPLTADPRWGIYQSGLYSENDEPKRSLAAFRFPFVAYARSGWISVWGRTPSSTAAQVVLERRTQAGWNSVRTVQAMPTGIFAAHWRSTRIAGLFRARAGAVASLPFSLTRPPERFARPFGCGGVVSC
jgi:cellulase (glycosyl hydrolase family 5)